MRQTPKAGDRLGPQAGVIPLDRAGGHRLAALLASAQLGLHLGRAQPPILLWKAGRADRRTPGPEVLVGALHEAWILANHLCQPHGGAAEVATRDAGEDLA